MNRVPRHGRLTALALAALAAAWPLGCARESTPSEPVPGHSPAAAAPASTAPSAAATVLPPPVAPATAPAAAPTTAPATHPATSPAAPAARAVPAQRAFRFTYAATVTGLRPGQVARVWVPVPPKDEDQDAEVDQWDLPGNGGDHSISLEPKYMNHVLYARAPAKDDGTVALSVTYRVTRKEVAGDVAAHPPKPGDPVDGSAPGRDGTDFHNGLGRNGENFADDPFLKPDALVPVGGRTLKLLEGRDLPADPLLRARALYNLVDGHMEYRKDKPGWGRGDAEWACDSRYGNCTDFHSLFIALARANHMPGKFEIGFSLPEPKDDKPAAGDVTGYHCWAKFRLPDRGWVPVDISEASKHPEMKDYYFGHLTPDRITFSIGRDITLEPKQDGPPLNFFIYPYVEVDGKPWPAEKVTKKFTYQDL